MAESTSPKGSSSDLTKKIQRQLSRSKEKVLQKLGKSAETRDDQFEHCLRQFNDQQTDGNRMYKDLRNYVSTVRDMHDASKRLAESLFDSYESDWAGEEDLGAIVEGENLLWGDYEVKFLDQAVRTMETYVSQFPDVREKIAKRGRKLVDYDSSRHHLEALQTAKKRDDIKIKKAEEEMSAAKIVYEGINNELKEELPIIYEGRIGCYISVFSAVSSLRHIFYKEMCTLNSDLQNVMKELQAQHPEKVFSVRGVQRYGSLRRRTLLSPKAWKASLSDFPKLGQSFSFRSPEKPRHSTLSRGSGSVSGSSRSSILDSPPSESRQLEQDLEAGTSHSEISSPPAEVETNSGTAEKGTEEDSKQVEEKKGGQDEASEAPAESDYKGDSEKAPPSESSSEMDDSHDSESLELKLAAVDDGPLHIEENDNSQVELDNNKENGLENGIVSGFKDLNVSTKDASVDNASQDTKTTTV